MTSRTWISVASFAAILVLCGCTTYVGQKIGPDGALSKTGGVPFVMTKPEYTVNVTADAKDATKPLYTLNVQYVPDATQRFTLALDPALFVNGKLDLDFGGHGNLTGAGATTATRIVDTFGAFVGAVIKAQTAGLLDAASTLSAYEVVISSTLHPGCAAVQESLKELQTEAKTEIPDRGNANRARAEWVGDRLHYLDQAQRDCMAEAAKRIKTIQEDPTEDIYKKALAASEEASKDNVELTLLNRQIKAEVAALNEDALSKIADGQTGRPAPFTFAQAAARAAEQFVKARLAGRFARSLADMSPDVWRARHLVYLERKITQCRAESLVPGSRSSCGEGAKIADKLAQLRADWSKTLGEPTIVDRIARIDSLLPIVQVSSRSDQGRHSMADEGIKLREERDKLQARVEQLRSDLIGKNRTVALGPDAPKTAPIEPRTNVSVTLAERTFVDAVNAKPADFKDADLPEFVLVLSPDDRGAVTPLPTPGGAKK